MTGLAMGALGTLMAGCASSAGVQAPRAALAAAEVRVPPSPHLTAMAPSGAAITGVGVEPKVVDLSDQHDRAARVRYRLDQPADVRVDLVDAEGRMIRRLEASRQAAGPHEVAWDGRADAGQPVPSGVYRYVLHARTADGALTTHDPSMTTGGEELEPRDFTFDRASGRLRWFMPRAGRARLRIGIQGFPHLRTLLDWEPMAAGPQEILWDGLDASGLIRAIDHPTLIAKLHAYALADNTIIVRGLPAGQAGRSSAASSLASIAPTYPPEQASERLYLHARHARPACHEARVSVSFPPQTPRDAQGHPVLTGTVPVQVALDPSDATYFVNQRFEVALYEDLTFLFEEEESTNPLTFLWDTARLPAGAHLLTVNVLSYDDHYGVVTQPVVINQ